MPVSFSLIFQIISQTLVFWVGICVWEKSVAVEMRTCVEGVDVWETESAFVWGAATDAYHPSVWQLRQQNIGFTTQPTINHP
jgi:hypothetical protein